jgi:hypothetical protein
MKTLAVGLLRDTLRRNRKNEIFKMVTTLGVVTLLGIGIAAAAISIGPVGIGDPAMRPLSAAPGLIVSPLTLPNGHMRLSREVACEQ